MSERVAVVEDQPPTGVALVPAMAPAFAATHRVTSPLERGRIPSQDRRGIALQVLEQVDVDRQGVLRNLAQSGAERTIREGRQRRDLAEDHARLMERPHEVLALGRFTAVFPPIDASTCAVSVVGTCTNGVPRM
jgi:hypothetical protein